MKEILVAMELTEAQRSLLEQQMPDAHYTYLPTPEATDEQLAAAQILLGNLPPALVAKARRLEWFQLNSSGADMYMKPGILPEGIRLTSATGSYGLAISEHLLAQTLFLLKKLHLYHRNQMQALWRDEGPIDSIDGSKTLVVGLGDIGSAYGQKMAMLGSTVYGIRRHRAEAPSWLAGLYTPDQLDELLPQMDIVALALPNTPETQHLFNAERLAKMKPGSILLNVGRGTAVDCMALCDALHSGPMAGAALDVTDPEPLPADHPLWQCENLLLTPHISRQHQLKQTQDRIVALCARNMAHFIKEEPLENPVDFDTGYRKFQ